MSEFIGVYGGAFDPPHVTHIECAKALIKERGYDSSPRSLDYARDDTSTSII